MLQQWPWMECGTACSDHLDANVAQLSRSWRHLHKGVPKAPPRKGAARQESQCFQAGMCICRRSPSGVANRQMWTSLRKALTEIAAAGFREPFVEAELFFLFAGRKSVATNETLQLAYCPLLYLRPFRPTFVMAKAASHEDLKVLVRLTQDEERPSEQGEVSV